MVRVYVSAVIDAAAERVWEQVRDFNGLPGWTSFVVHSRIEGEVPSDQIGCVRNFKLRDGGTIREQLLALSDYDYTFIYSILESPLGVNHYVATFKLLPVTDNDQTFIEWTAEFECSPGRERELEHTIGQQVFQSALNTLKEKFA